MHTLQSPCGASANTVAPHSAQAVLAFVILSFQLIYRLYLYCRKIFVKLRLQHGDEMSQLILDVARRRDRVGNLFVYQLPIAMAQTVKCLFDGVFGHPHFGGDLSLRRVAGTSDE
jgi:hypothetical protein